MEDFFSILLERIIDIFTMKFEFIKNPVVKIIVQVAIMLVICALFIGFFLLYCDMIRGVLN